MRLACHDFMSNIVSAAPIIHTNARIIIHTHPQEIRYNINRSYLIIIHKTKFMLSKTPNQFQICRFLLLDIPLQFYFIVAHMVTVDTNDFITFRVILCFTWKYELYRHLHLTSRNIKCTLSQNKCILFK